jgi:hypothetical protein
MECGFGMATRHECVFPTFTVVASVFATKCLAERPQELHNLLGMPPEFAGASPEPKVVQGFADFHVRLPLIS